MLETQTHQATEVMISMVISGNGYINTSGKVSKENGNLMKPCLGAHTHKQECHHRLLESIKANRLSFIDGDKHCQNCYEVSKDIYSEMLNKGELSISYPHYSDINAGVILFNLTNIAFCEHVEPRILRQGFKEILDDFEASVKHRKYVVNFKNAYSALEYLKDQQFVIEDGDIDSNIKYVIGLPNNRVSTIEDESRALALLSNRPIICNFQDRCFWVT